jgi:hypothetical protein
MNTIGTIYIYEVKMYIRVDVILWVFLQNVILLPSEYLMETEEYEIFQNAEQCDYIYILSCKDIRYEMLYTKRNCYPNDIVFDTFQNMLYILQTLLEDNTLKKNLIINAIPILKRMNIENLLNNLRI